MFETQLLTALISSSTAILGAWFVNFLNRKKIKVETENLIDARYRGIIEEQRTEREADRALIEANKKVIKELERSNETCEWDHEVTRLELQQVKKKINYQTWQKEAVFILDDNPMVTTEFKWRFGKISVLDCRTFVDTELFLSETQKQKPEIVILDYYLKGDETAQDVLHRLGYEPEVFIMSADREIQVKLKEKGMRVFYKDEHYVFKIAKAVIQHLHDKN